MEDFDENLWRELRRQAEAALRNEAPGHSLQPTMLVNDVYLKLREQKNVDAEDRSRVFAVCANLLRQILVDYARKRRAEKRGGADGRGESLCIDVPEMPPSIDVLELDEALTNLHEKNPRAADVVELRYFSEMSVKDVADHLDISERTVKNDWRFAKAWLSRELDDSA